MIVPFLLLLLSLVGIAAALTLPDMAGLLLVAGPCALGSLYLLARAWARGRTGRAVASQKMIVIDGSNAMHWKDGTPRLETLREILHRLSSLGFTPGIVFDANAGYKLTGRYQHHAAMGKLLGLPEDAVMVVSKGEPADPTILAAARSLGARILTNDRYTDWADAHPELRAPGHLIRGGYRAGKLWLDLDRGDAQRP